jgi:site-specific DNA-adenine methylase
MTYPGGKAGSGVYQQIINQIPPHRVYIEPFLGGGAVLLHKLPAVASIVIDCDATVIEAWYLREDLPAGTIVSFGDAISFLETYDFKGDEFVYCDPPYLFETRSGKGRIYNNEFGGVDQHIKLLQALLALPCPVAISGYWSSLYAEILATWRTISYMTRTRGGNTVREWLWMNYPEPLELHDYRYLGDNFRQRERLKRIRTRWLARLGRMDALERYALLSSIGEFSDGIRKASLEMASPPAVSSD